jgi:flavodoxin
MKSLIVFYSLEGNTRLTAKELASKMDADLLELETVVPYPVGKFSKFLKGGRSAIKAETPELKPYQADLDNYDLIVLGMPVWASMVTPPMRTFLKENSIKDKKVAAFICCAGGETEKAFASLSELAETTFIDTIRLVDPAKGKQPDLDAKLEEFVNSISQKM